MLAAFLLLLHHTCFSREVASLLGQAYRDYLTMVSECRTGLKDDDSCQLPLSQGIIFAPPFVTSMLHHWRNRCDGGVGEKQPACCHSSLLREPRSSTPLGWTEFPVCVMEQGGTDGMFFCDDSWDRCLVSIIPIPLQSPSSHPENFRHQQFELDRKEG